MIKFEHVSKVYGEKEALSDLTLSVKDNRSQWSRKNNDN